MDMNKYTIKQLAAIFDSLHKTIVKFDDKAEIMDNYITASKEEGFDLILTIEFLSSNGKVESMSRYVRE